MVGQNQLIDFAADSLLSRVPVIRARCGRRGDRARESGSDGWGRRHRGPQLRHFI